MKVIFSNRAYTALLSEVYEKIKTETGGVFLGYYEDDTWYIVEAIDPGPDSVFEVAYFEYDQPYVNHLINKVARIYKKNLSLIGLWHRHPGSFDVFSGTDDGTNAKYAKLATQGAISALVNVDPTFRLTVYHVGNPLKYKRIKYEVGDELFPDGVLSLHSIVDYTRFINTYDERRNGAGSCVVPRVTFTEIINEACGIIDKLDALKHRDELYEATRQTDYIEVVSNIIDEDLAFISETLNIKLTVKLDSGYICMVDEQNPDTVIHFSFIKSIGEFVFIYDNWCYIYESGLLKKAITSKQNGQEKSGLFARLRKWLGL